MLHNLMKNMDEGAAVFSTEFVDDSSDIKFNLLWCNKSFEDMFEARSSNNSNCFSYQIFRDAEFGGQEISLL